MGLRDLQVRWTSRRVSDIHDRHYTGLIVDPVDNPVSAAAGAEPVIHRREQPLADPVRIGTSVTYTYSFIAIERGGRYSAVARATDTSGNMTITPQMPFSIGTG